MPHSTSAPLPVPPTDHVACVVVTFHPDLQRFAALLEAVRKQVAHIVVVDNGSGPECAASIAQQVRACSGTWIALGHNKGVAAALNVGIQTALDGGCSHLLLLDHDSIPAPDMVQKLLAAWRSKSSGLRVAAVGPRYVDDRQQNPPPFIRVQGLRVLRCACETEGSVVEVDYLITSGSLIPAETFREVGPMAEHLFVDYVDIEWGLRARRMGYQSYGACAARMSHTLGDAPIEFMGRRLPLHSPLRHYYHMRNALWLYLHADLPLHWKLADGWRLLLKYVFYSLFARPRWAHFSMMSRGLWHGMRGRLGPLA